MKILKRLFYKNLFILVLMQLSNCTDIDTDNNANTDVTPEKSTINKKIYSNNSNANKNDTKTDVDKYTGVWLFTINGEATESGEKSAEIKAQKMVLIKKINTNTLSFDSCDALDIFGYPTDPGFTVLSDSINETRQNGVGNNVTFTFNFINDKTATGISHFTEGSYESHEDIEAEKISTSLHFEPKDDEIISVSELIVENKSLMSAPSEFSINCFSVSQHTNYYLYSEKKVINFIINGEDRIIKSTALTVQGVDSENNELVIDTLISDAPQIFSSSISILYTDNKFIEHAVDFYILDEEKDPEDTDVTAQISGLINIERSSASINVVADDKEGNSAAADFSLNF